MLDGESTGTAVPDVATAHVRDCQPCGRWLDAAEQIGRGIRLETVTEPSVDMVALVLPAITLPRIDRRVRWVRIALFVIGAVQVAVGFAGLAENIGMSMHGMHMSAHMSHELVAFNVSFGAAMLVIAARIDYARSQVPMLATFVGILGIVGIFDLATGEVGWVRLATHAPVVIGLALAIYASRLPATQLDPSGPTSARPKKALSAVHSR